MAGGEGTRLRPLTMSQPKPMLPMANRPMAEHVLGLLRNHGFDEIVVTVAYLANTIRTYFGDGSEFGVRIVYATEETPLGTAGSVLNARDELTERFLVISGDVLTDVDLGELVRAHDAAGAVATLALKAMENPLEFGIVITDPDGRVARFLEKPTWGQVFSDTVNTGIYVLEPEVLDAIEPGRAVDFSSEVFPALLAGGARIQGCLTDRYWEDVGTLDAYLRAHADILDAKVGLRVDAFPVRPGVFVGEGVEIDPTAEVEAPALIGANCRVGPHARIGPYAVLGVNVRVGEGAELVRTVVHDNCYLGARVRARGSVVGRSCELRQGARLDEGAVLGDGCRVGADALIAASVKVYPSKTVEEGALVTTSVVWESRAARALFGRVGVTGLANVDLSPELAVRVAMAYATALPKGSTIAVSRDSSRAARVLKRAVMVGVNAAGLNVEDLEAATVPVTRFQVRSGQSRGGVTIRLDPDDPQSVVIRFLDAEGNDLDDAAKRAVERLYYREESRRVLASEIGDIEFPPRTAELYTLALVRDVDLERIRAARFKLVLDYAYGTASLVMPSVLAKLGAEVLVVNPLVSTPGVIGYDRDVHTARLAELVRSSGAHLGAVIAPDGERLWLVDDTGHVLDDTESLLLLTSLVTAARRGARVAAPVNATRAVAEICARAGATLACTTLGGAAVAGEHDPADADLVADTRGGFAFPAHLRAPDAVAALVHLLELASADGRALSEVVASLPATFVAHEEVATPFELKGSVMRHVLERARAEDLVLVDGVKCVDGDGTWTLVAPDAVRPTTHVYAEGWSGPDATERVARAAGEVRRILQLS